MPTTKSLLPALLAFLSLSSAAPTAQTPGGSYTTTSQTTYNGGSTASDVQNGVCAPITVLFARGTFEAGNIGNVIGPALFSDLVKLTNGQIALQGLDYAASIAGDFTFGSQDGPKLTALMQQALSQCPQTKLLLSGYSQGCLVIHNALNSAGSGNAVGGVAYFGDPLYNRAGSGSVPSSRVQEYCATGDGVCETGGFAVTPAHLSYASDAQPAAQFLLQAAGAGGSTAGGAGPLGM